MKQLECLTYDPEYAKFDLCELDTSLRNNPTLSIAIRLLTIPVTNINLRVEVGLLGSSPPIIVLNNSWDGCAFLKSRKSNKVFGRLYRYIAPYTNLNHSCPINHDVIIKNLTVAEGGSALAMLGGEFVAKVYAASDGKTRISIKVTSSY
ncbi:uncharacterized protein LOC106084705 [Stomoxys calcitrans]|uniref:uncharacterized protein LOC106084705 n=1 Tax=Stomoxys calcitrans TaxID=35570 RepID=UPI0027E2DFA0|nr:uncharacterized protein LOC106084705 [Stomoxys calcitrans]